MLTAKGFELGKRLLDRIEAGRVGRQRPKFGACPLYPFAGAPGFMRGKIIGHGNGAGRERGDEDFLHIDKEGGAIHGGRPALWAPRSGRDAGPQ